jgi:hypothetical protein
VGTGFRFDGVARLLSLPILPTGSKLSTVKSLENIASEALLLPKDQRFTLAHRILSSVEPEMEANVEAAWDLEIRERIRRYDAGQTPGLAGREVFAELDKKLKQ